MRSRGTRRLGIVLACAIACAGCDRSPTPSPPRYLALGDSYTIGQSVREADRWPMQLAAAVRGQGDDVGLPQIVARTGWTTRDLLAAMDAAPLERSYAIVTLMIGVNDEFRGRSVDAFRADVATLLDRSVRLAGGDARRVVAVSIPDWGVTPFAAGRDRAAIATAIDAFNVAYADECARRGVAYVDVTPISRTAVTRPTELVAGDGLHPSPAMYARWVEAIAPAARRASRVVTAR